jgi:hypothetical protein
MGARWFSTLAASSWGTPVFSSPRDRLAPWLLAALSSGATIPPGLAVLILEVLGKRLARYGLMLHPDKTRFVDFRPERKGGTHPWETLSFRRLAPL